MSSKKNRNNETFETASALKKLKLFEKINDNKNSKGKKVKINKSEKSSTTEENTNNLEKEEKKKNANDKDKNNENINIMENNNSNLKEFFPFDNNYIFKDFQEINDVQMNELNKNKCYSLINSVKKKKYAENFLKPILEMVKKKEIIDLYKEVIKKQMDLNTIGKNLINDCYTNIGCFLQDYSLIITNAQNFNEKNSIIFKNAEKIKIFSKKYLQQSFNNEINEQKNKERILLSPKKEFKKTKEEENEILRTNQKEKENNKYENKKDNFNKDDLLTEEIYLRDKKKVKIALYIEKFNEKQIIKFLTQFKNMKDNNCIINFDNFKDKDLDIILEFCKKIENENKNGFK